LPEEPIAATFGSAVKGNPVIRLRHGCAEAGRGMSLNEKHLKKGDGSAIAINAMEY